MLEHGDELRESVGYLQGMPPILRQTLPDLHTRLAEQLAERWQVPAEQVMGCLLCLSSSEAPAEEESSGAGTPGVGPDPAAERTAYFARWPHQPEAHQLAHNRLEDLYRLGWTPKLLHQAINRDQNVAVPLNALELKPGRAAPRHKHARLLAQHLIQKGPLNPTFRSDLPLHVIQAEFAGKGEGGAITPGQIERLMRRAGAYTLAQEVKQVPAHLYEQLFKHTADFSEVSQHRELLSRVASFLHQTGEIAGQTVLIRELNQHHTPQQPVNEQLYDLGYRGKPLDRIIPYSGEFYPVIRELLAVFRTQQDNPARPGTLNQDRLDYLILQLEELMRTAEPHYTEPGDPL